MADLKRMIQFWFVKAQDDLRVSRALLDFKSEHLEAVATVDKDLALKFKKAEILTKYAVAYRYPEEVEVPEPVTKTVAEAAFKMANEIFETLNSKSV